jgi:hypothetical protein
MRGRPFYLLSACPWLGHETSAPINAVTPRGGFIILAAYIVRTLSMAERPLVLHQASRRFSTNPFIPQLLEA